jgi:hypothetical protein
MEHETGRAGESGLTADAEPEGHAVVGLEGDNVPALREVHVNLREPEGGADLRPEGLDPAVLSHKPRGT